MKKQFLKKNKYKFKREKIQYTEKKHFLGDKEIIFRSGGRAKVFNISHRLQVAVLAFMALVFCWSGYNYYYYHISERIIHRKDKELGKTRDAYVDLMTDVAVLQKNMQNVVKSIDEAGDGLAEIKSYKEQALAVEDKIKQIADSEEWISSSEMENKMTEKEAAIQNEIMQKENSLLRQKVENLSVTLTALQENMRGLESAEIDILDKIARISGKEIDQIKASLTEINKTLKGKNRYFNPLSNMKEGKGGTYVPAEGKISNPELTDKMSSTLQQIDKLAEYKAAFKSVPLGEPVHRYQISSTFGSRSDPFNNNLAAHKGLDMRAAKGSRISVMAAGKVKEASFKKGYGNMVEIDHGNGFVTRYAHMNKIYVKKGDKVGYNHALGEVGRTGRATGDHLHYEVLYRGANVNPLTFVKIRSMNES